MPNGNVVLLVEDNPTLLNLFTEALDAERFEVVAAGGVQAAREVLATRQPLCAVFADYTLPDGNGTEIIKEARTRWPHASGVVMTGHADLEVDDGIGILRKPFDLSEFTKAVNAACVRGCVDSSVIPPR